MREFTGLRDLNSQTRTWLDEIANAKIHGQQDVYPGTPSRGAEIFKTATPN